MRYLLDANIVSYFLKARREDDLAAACVRLPLVIADAVKEELENWADVLLELQRATGVTKDKGERASIAIAAANNNLVFVSNDKGGMWLALHELHEKGERMVGAHVFLRRLHEDGGLPIDAVAEVARLVQGRKPVWWTDWRAARLAV